MSLLAVPVYFYGWARHDRRSLSEVRSKLGYFRPKKGGQWEGAPTSSSLRGCIDPDLGSSEIPENAGCAAVGAVPWVFNYNVPVKVDNMAIAKQMAREVSERGGGLPAVEAMALAHGQGSVEIACNLLDASSSSPRDVQNLVEELCARREIEAGSGYLTGISPGEIIEIFESRHKKEVSQ